MSRWTRRITGRGATITLLVILMAIIGPPPAQGQGVESVREGARVRLAADGERMTGTLVERGRDTLWVGFDHADAVRAVPLAGVQRLEVSRERRSNAGRGALAGFVVGAIPGVVSGATCDCGNRGTAVLLLGAFTGGIGAAIGAVLGATSHHDVWEVVPVAAAASNHLVVGVTATFRPRLR